MKVILGNGEEIAYLEAAEREEYCVGSNRHTLTFLCAADAISLDVLNAILSDAANTETLVLVESTIMEEVRDGELVTTEIPETNTCEGYTMKLNVGIEKVMVQPETPDSAAVYADRLVFKLGRPTFIEQQLAKLGISG